MTVLHVMGMEGGEWCGVLLSYMRIVQQASKQASKQANKKSNASDGVSFF
jgi:hypothetical protein